MTRTLTLRDANQSFARRIREVEAGEEFVITRNGVPVAASASAVRAALASAASGRASYWDALLVVTAAEAGCTAILTEDFSDGAILHSVRVLNPFAGSELPPAALALLTGD